MIRAKDLDGRAVVDLVTAEKLGYIDEIYLDPSGGQLAALKVSTGSTLLGGGRRVLVPASAIESIGPEAVMVRPSAEGGAVDGSLDSLPRLSHIVGKKVVSDGGKLLGSIGDVLIEGADSRILGYELKDASWGGLSDMLKVGEDHQRDYVRGDADLRLSDELLVVPENAIVRGASHTDDTVRVPRDHVVDREPSGARQAVRTDSATVPVTGAAPTAARRWDDVRPHLRSRWEQNSSARGGLWEEQEPGYRYGWEMRNDPQYRGQSWSAIEPDLQRGWESRYQDRPWTSAHTSIRDGWDSSDDVEATYEPSSRTVSESETFRQPTESKRSLL